MKINIFLLGFLMPLTACNFDGERQFDLQFPARLVVSNGGDAALEVESIYNAGNTDIGFALNGFNLSSNEEVIIPISMDTLSALESKDAAFKGRCPSGNSWRVGAQSFHYTKPSASEIRIELTPCDS